MSWDMIWYWQFSIDFYSNYNLTLQSHCEYSSWVRVTLFIIFLLQYYCPNNIQSTTTLCWTLDSIQIQELYYLHIWASQLHSNKIKCVEFYFNKFYNPDWHGIKSSTITYCSIKSIFNLASVYFAVSPVLVFAKSAHNLLAVILGLYYKCSYFPLLFLM